MVTNPALITKVYFPRLAIPVAAVLASAVDLLLATTMVAVAMTTSREPWSPVWLPLGILAALVASLAVSSWLSALNVRYRDVRHALPFLLQLWLFVSPIAYPTTLIPQEWRLLYSANPLVAPIELYRLAFVSGVAASPSCILASSVSSLVLLSGGLVFFLRTERSFADLV
jgi:lipopolysaccharide transport system permease protein